MPKDLLGKIQGRSKPVVAKTELEPYSSEKIWLVEEIVKGIEAAERGELIGDDAMEVWFRSIGAAK